jgi:hypothetical protein
VIFKIGLALSAVRLLIMEPDGELITAQETARATLTDDGQRWVVVNQNRIDRDLDQWLLHEMAHHEAWSRYGPDIQTHGPEFRKVCREFVTRRQSHFCKAD